MRNAIMKISASVFLAAVFLFALGTSSALGTPVSGIDVRYTSDADFDKGSLMNLNHNVVHDQLQLSDTITPFPFINIANSGRGTIVRIDVNTGTILGEYYTSPNGMGRDPSRTTVDQFGNVWVSNRAEAGTSGGKSKGSITRIGLIIGGTRANADGSANPTGQYLKPPFQYNTCIDRNGDGLIKTSRAADNILAWTNAGGADTHGGVSTADDECIINYTRVIATRTRTVAIDANNDVWVGGDNTAHEKVDGITGQPVPGTQFNLGCGGYGGLIDKNGVLWSARYGSGLLRYDTKTMTGKCVSGFTDGYGLALDPNTGNIWHTYYTGNRVAKIAPDGTLLATYSHGAYYSQGVVVDKSGNVWIANATNASSVAHLRTDGTYVGLVSTGQGPTGVAVDSNGKVWSTNYYAWTTSRIDPNAGAVGGGGFKIGAVDKTVNLGYNAYPYNYSDMTGYVAIGGTSPQGTWTVVQDSGVAGNEWGTITWNSETQGNVPDGAIILVEARAADTEAGLSSKSFIAVSNNEPFVLTGRYLEVRATLKPNSSGEKPVLSDLRISITPISDVRVIDTISSANIFIKDGSFTREPYSITYGSDTIAIEWRFDSFTIGQINDLSYSVTMKNPVPGEDRLVDHKIEVLYTDINGKPVRYETGPQSVLVLSSKYSSSIATDKQSYGANQNAVISATITNLSQFARTIDAKITIEDSAGALVQEVATLSGLSFASGETKNFNNLVFHTGTTYAGNYRARIVLYESQNQVGEASEGFTISPDIVISTKIVTDKVSYKANEQATITSTVTSQSANTILENLTAKVTVVGTQGQALHTETTAISQLMQGQMTTLKTYWNTAGNPAGAYLVTLEVFRGSTLLSSSTASFEIVATSATGGGLTGTITAQINPVDQGANEILAYTVTNSGNDDLSNLAIKILIVNPDTQEIKQTFESSADIPKTVTRADNATASTAGYFPRSYVAILQAAPAGMSEPKTLASTAFTVRDVTPPAVTILSPENGKYYKAQFDVAVTAIDTESGVDKVEYQVDGGEWKPLSLSDAAANKYATVWSPAPADEGARTIIFRATDKAGNSSTSVPTSFTIDVTPAAITIVSPVTGSYITSKFDIAALVTDGTSGVAGVEYQVDNGAWKPLPASASSDTYATPWAPLLADEGDHTIRFRATDRAGNTSDPVPTTVTIEVLFGSLTAQPDPVYQGMNEALTYTVTSNAFAAVAGAKVNVLIIDPDTQEVKQTFEAVTDLGATTTITGSFTASTRNLMPKKYSAVLKVAAAGLAQPKTLASTTFEVKPGMEVSKTIPDQKRVLVWLNYPWQSGQNCPDRSVIEQALESAGLLYHIVLDKDDFEQEFRNRFYTDFMILGDYNPLEDHFAAELREQVNAGKGLIYSLFNRQNLDSSVLNLKFTGALPTGCGTDDAYCELQGRTIEFEESEIASAGNFSATGRVLKVEAYDQAEVVAWAPEATSKGIVRYPAVIRRPYGQGHLIFFAFDLGMSASSSSAYLNLILNSATYIHRAPDTTSVRPGQLIPVELTIKSLGAAYSLRLSESYPAGVQIYDPVKGNRISDNPWVRLVELSADETKTLVYDVVVPDAAGLYTFSTQIDYVDGGSYVPYQNLAIEMTVGQSTTMKTADMLSALQAMNLSGNEASARDNVVRSLTDVANRQVQSQIDREAMIADLRAAATDLLVITSRDTTNVRLGIDVLLLFWEADWYFHRAP